MTKATLPAPRSVVEAAFDAAGTGEVVVIVAGPRGLLNPGGECANRLLEFLDDAKAYVLTRESRGERTRVVHTLEGEDAMYAEASGRYVGVQLERAESREAALEAASTVVAFWRRRRPAAITRELLAARDAGKGIIAVCGTHHRTSANYGCESCWQAVMRADRAKVESGARKGDAVARLREELGRATRAEERLRGRAELAARRLAAAEARTTRARDMLHRAEEAASATAGARAKSSKGVTT